MSVCTFFGHRDCYGLDTEELYRAIEDLIGQGVDTFYVGKQGNFDAAVRKCLKELCTQYCHINYAVVLAYLPAPNDGYDYSDTMYPEGLEAVPPKFAIQWRNRWMIAQASHCLCWIDRTWGGAYKFANIAKHRNLTLINLGSAKL